MDLVDFEKLLESSGFVITGEGKLDSQSLDGKVISGIGRRAKKKQVPMVIVTGECEKGLTGLESLGIQAIFETGKLDPAKPLPELLASCRVALANTADVLGQYLRRNM